MSSILSSILGSRSKHLPPGPPGLPIIGNLKDIPSTEQWKYFYEQSQKYSEYPSLRLSISSPRVVLVQPHTVVLLVSSCCHPLRPPSSALLRDVGAWEALHTAAARAVRSRHRPCLSASSLSDFVLAVLVLLRSLSCTSELRCVRVLLRDECACGRGRRRALRLSRGTRLQGAVPGCGASRRTEQRGRRVALLTLWRRCCGVVCRTPSHLAAHSRGFLLLAQYSCWSMHPTRTFYTCGSRFGPNLPCRGYQT